MQNDVIDVGGGGGGCGEGVGARSSTPAAAAGFAADAGSEGGGAAEWQMVTRGKARALPVEQVSLPKELNR